MKLIVTITAALMALNTLDADIISLPGYIYMGWFVVVALFMLLKERRLNVMKSGLILIVVAFASLCFNINIIYQPLTPWLRLLIFVVIFACVGPLIDNKTSAKFKTLLLERSIQYIFIVIAISFLLYILNENSAILYHKNLYKGLTRHSMILSPLAAICSLYFMNKVFNKSHILINIVFLLISILSSILAASRGALGALLAAMVFYLMIRYRKKMSRFFLIMTSIGVLIISTYSFWSKYTMFLSTKMEQRADSGDLLAGRELMWTDLLQDFQMRPILGVGYNNVFHTHNTRIEYVDGAITYEPGNGWLLILANLGVIGFVTILYLFFGKFRSNINNCNRTNNMILYISLIVFYSIHLIVEGYVFAIGNSLFVLLWLTVALANQRYSYSHKSSKKVLR